MSEKSAQKPSNPLIVLGDRLARKPHLTSFLQSLRQENKELNEDSEVKFAVCADTNEVAGNAETLPRRRENGAHRPRPGG
jgi:hypothetical protein